jgi:Tol biopolymer transport system component
VAVPSKRAPAVAIAIAISLTGCAWIQRSSVSSAPATLEGNQASDRPSLSQTGRFVAFDSLAGNLVAGDTNAASDVFVRDHVRQTTERVSVASDGSQANGASRNASISDDGRFVAFETDASNLFTDDGNGKSDIVVRDRQLGTTTLVSINALVSVLPMPQPLP